jgi:hypothetical protein
VSLCLELVGKRKKKGLLARVSVDERFLTRVRDWLSLSEEPALEVGALRQHEERMDFEVAARRVSFETCLNGS